MVGFASYRPLFTQQGSDIKSAPTTLEADVRTCFELGCKTGTEDVDRGHVESKIYEAV